MKWTQVSRGEGSKISLGQKPGAAEPWWPCKESQFSRVRALPTISVEVRSRVGEDSKNFKLWAFVSAHSLKKKIHTKQTRNVSALTTGLTAPEDHKEFLKTLHFDNLLARLPTCLLVSRTVREECHQGK